jgi:5-methylcytosine-specific restriction endonuclease McrBC regulatory subunit McrC
MKIFQISDNSSKNCGVEETASDLRIVANKPLWALLKENPDILVYPEKFRREDQDQAILYVDNKNCVRTGNIMGFIGIGDTLLKISSRFSNRENDFFLYRMLSLVLDINILNFKFADGEDSVFQFLYCLFPWVLKKACQQGLFKKYTRTEHNDSNIRGVIDFSRHIKTNVPFVGKIAYNTREFSTNNHLTHLIRHTIEHIRRHSLFHELLHSSPEMTACVQKIENATPNFKSADLPKVINQNRKPTTHPYFTEYTALQKLCLRILLREKTAFSNNSQQKIWGILFDGACLWEEYLNKVLTRHDVVFAHPNNRNGSLKDTLFIKRRPISPDFIKYADDKKISAYWVADAKYKHRAVREDYYQVCAYMYRYSCKGVIVYPFDDGITDDEGIPLTKFQQNTIKGHDKDHQFDLFEYGMHIPQEIDNMDGFFTEIQKQEEELVLYFEKMG